MWGYVVNAITAVYVFVPCVHLNFVFYTLLCVVWSYYLNGWLVLVLYIGPQNDTERHIKLCLAFLKLIIL